MGGTDVTEVTRRCVATALAVQNRIQSLTMKPVVFAREHRVSDENLRGLRKYNNCAEHDEWQSGINPATLSKSWSCDRAQAGNPVDVTQCKRNDRAAEQPA